MVTSLRGIQQASELGKVQKKLGCSRAALGSLFEAAIIFDAERLKEIIAELGAELKPLGRDARLVATVPMDSALIPRLRGLRFSCDDIITRGVSEAMRSVLAHASGYN